MPAFLNWQETYDAGPAICGGKGYNLARLQRYGFRVPRGGVLPAGAPLSEIAAGLERLGLTQVPVAVRSSATGEDSSRASFAGIHRSFLNVTGIDAVLHAAQGCLDSLQTPEAIAYRQRMGFRDDEVRCAIVICEMVRAQCAGVAFSCDPATGRRDLIVIDAAEGLGDAVVSGLVNPQRITWVNVNGVCSRLDGPAIGPLSLQAEEELVWQVRRVQWALGEGQDPQDVEWAYDGQRLWLLQARPVTRLARAGFTETANIPRYWSTANIKDAVPGVLCELSWSMLGEAVGPILFATQQTGRIAMPPGMEIVRRFHGRGYFDLTMIQWALYDAYGVLPADVVKSLGGHQPTIEVPPDPLKGPHGSRRKRAALRLLRKLWSYPKQALLASAAQMDYMRQLEQIDWRPLSLASIRERLVELGKRQTAFLNVAGLANSSSGPWQLALENLMDDRGLVNRLQAGTGNVISAEQGYLLYDIARGKATVADFLRDYGHRTVYEADLLNPRWAEDATWILEQVEAIRAHPPERDPREIAFEVRHNAEAELKRRFPLRAPLVRWLVKKMADAMAARERSKSAMVSILLPVRRMMLELGRRMVAEGKLDSPEQAMHLAAIDIDCWLRGYWDGDGARQLAVDRDARRTQWLSEIAPDLVTEEPDGRLAAPPPFVVPEGDSWSGIAVSPGAATGIARLVGHPKDGAHLERGDILVAPSTDPGWTPLFLRASGIVMETGGFLSHGAIVAREYGIPAVANVPGILQALRDGEEIAMDGSRGIVARTKGIVRNRQ